MVSGASDLRSILQEALMKYVCGWWKGLLLFAFLLIVLCVFAFSTSLHRQISGTSHFILRGSKEQPVTLAQIPPGFEALVPAGAQVSSPQFSKIPRVLSEGKVLCQQARRE